MITLTAGVVHCGVSYKLVGEWRPLTLPHATVYVAEQDPDYNDRHYFLHEFATNETIESVYQTHKLLMLDDAKILRACIDDDFA